MYIYKRALVWIGLVVCVLALAACTPSLNSLQVEQPQDQVIVKDRERVDVGSSDEEGDGEVVYEVVVSYDNPGGADDVGFRLTVENGVVKGVEVDVLAKNSTSVNRQRSFQASLGAAVVGKPLAGLRVDKVGGSSLTTKAFNDWVAKLN